MNLTWFPEIFYLPWQLEGRSTSVWEQEIRGRNKKKRKFEVVKMYFHGAEISMLQKFNEGL